MFIREATIHDIPQIQLVRNSVTENTLSDPALVTDEDCKAFITERGRGWVSVIGGKIVGFSIADLREHNIWALFIRPAFEKQGIGKQLHDIMLDWYFAQTKVPVWLEYGTRYKGRKFLQESRLDRNRDSW